MNNKLKYVLGTAVAAITLAVIIPTAQTQGVPPPIAPVPTGGFSFTPVVTDANKVQPVDPRGLYDYYADYYAPNAYNVSFGTNDIPRTSDTISARKEANNQLYMKWQGEPRAVRNITFAVLDSNNKVISRKVVTDLPAEARLMRTTKTTSYSVTVQYINGMSTTVMSPL